LLLALSAKKPILTFYYVISKISQAIKLSFCSFWNTTRFINILRHSSNKLGFFRSKNISRLKLFSRVQNDWFERKRKKYEALLFERSMLNNLDGWFTRIWYATKHRRARLIVWFHIFIYIYIRRHWRRRITHSQAIEQMFCHRSTRWMMFGETNEMSLRTIALRIGSARISPCISQSISEVWLFKPQLRQLIEKLAWWHSV